LFVRAGSIIPMGVQVPSTATRQKLDSIRVYPGRSTSFTVYDDDGVSTRKTGTSAVLRWDDGTKRLTASGKLPTGQDPSTLVKVMAR
jgi:alpha-D-xyloside xylohydrolase